MHIALHGSGFLITYPLTQEFAFEIILVAGQKNTRLLSRCWPTRCSLRGVRFVGEASSLKRQLQPHRPSLFGFTSRPASVLGSDCQSFWPRHGVSCELTAGIQDSGMVHGQIFRLRGRGPAPRDRLNSNRHSHSILTYPTDILPVVENRTIQRSYQAFWTTSGRSRPTSGEANRDSPPALTDAESANAHPCPLRLPLIGNKGIR